MSRSIFFTLLGIYFFAVIASADAQNPASAWPNNNAARSGNAAASDNAGGDQNLPPLYNRNNVGNSQGAAVNAQQQNGAGANASSAPNTPRSLQKL